MSSAADDERTGLLDKGSVKTTRSYSTEPVKTPEDHVQNHGHDDHGHSHNDHGHSHGEDGHEEHGCHGASAHHGASPNDSKRTNAKRALSMALVLCLIFMVVELVFGILAHSLALMTDAAHMLTDVGAMSMSLMALQLSQRSANKKFTYGWHRAEVIGAFSSVLTIWALVGIILYEGVQRCYAFYMCNFGNTLSDCQAIDGKTMMLIGGLGFAINIIVAAILGFGGAGHSHSHGAAEEGDHGHSHGGTDAEGTDNLNLRAAFLHALGDCVQSVGVIAAAAVIWIGNMNTYGQPAVAHSMYNIADPACSILFAVITLFTTTGLFRQLLHILMETVPGNVDYDKLLKELLAVPDVVSVHDLHVWSLTTDKLSLSVHLVSDKHREALEAAQDVCTRHGIAHTTIQVDAPDSEHIERCKSNLACGT